MQISNQDLPSELDRFDPKNFKIGTHLMLFSPWCYGHYPNYLRHLIRYWCQWQLPGTLSIVVSPDFIHEHADVVALATGEDLADRNRVKFVTMTEREQSELESKTSGWSRAFQQYRLVAKYASQIETTQVLYMYFDSCQLPLAIGFKLPCACSGIYFRPTFHYSLLPNYAPNWQERIQQLRERFFLSRILAHPQIQTLFCIDPIAVDAINQLSKKVKSVGLADPIEVEECSHDRVSQFKQHLGIEPDRRVFLSFGRLTDARKGVIQLIKAVSLLSPELCGKICLLFAGEPDGVGAEMLQSWLTPISQNLPVQIVTRYGYIPESDVQLYFQASDTILAPYQKHVGMSGILLLAAAAEKPVLSSSYGLMGEMVRRYGLGLAVDSTNPAEIAQGLTRFLLESADELSDRTKMQHFVEQNSAERFARSIFEHTVLDPPQIL
jgi:glycosyltransferase involved in cell wall biosynthesis